MKPGIKTTEFGLTATAVIAAIANTLGLLPAQAEVAHAVNGTSLTLLAVTLGWQYIATRLRIKLDPTDSAIGRAIDTIRPQLEQLIVDRLTAAPKADDNQAA